VLRRAARRCVEPRRRGAQPAEQLAEHGFGGQPDLLSGEKKKKKIKENLNKRVFNKKDY
jgi:hypothetical protein